MGLCVCEFVELSYTLRVFFLSKLVQLRQWTNTVFNQEKLLVSDGQKMFYHFTYNSA